MATSPDTMGTEPQLSAGKDFAFEHKAKSYFEMRSQLAQQADDVDAVAHTQAMQEQLAKIADKQYVETGNLRETSEAVADLAMMSAAAMSPENPYERENFESLPADLQKEQQLLVVSSESLFQKACEKIYPDVELKYGPRTEMDKVFRLVGGIKSEVLGRVRQMIPMERDMLSSLEDANPQEVYTFVNRYYFELLRSAHSISASVLETRQAQEMDPKIDEQYKSDLIRINEAAYRLSLLRDQLQQQFSKKPTTKETVRREPTDPREEKFGQILQNLLDEEKQGVTQAREKGGTVHAKQFDVYLPVVAKLYPGETFAGAIRKALLEIKELKQTLMKTGDEEYMARNKAVKMFLDSAESRQPGIRGSLETAAEQERKRQLDSVGDGMKAAMVATPSYVLGKLFDRAQTDGLI